MPEGHFGGRVAERFDERYAHKADPRVVDPIVSFIADLAVGGGALEFGVGTGRIALPLARRGVPLRASNCLRNQAYDLSGKLMAKKPRKGVAPNKLNEFQTYRRRCGTGARTVPDSEVVAG